MTPARRAALLRMLEDWEAGRLVPRKSLRGHAPKLERDGLIEHAEADLYRPTPTGLAAARQAKEDANG